jgi:serine/threonine protein kinase
VSRSEVKWVRPISDVRDVVGLKEPSGACNPQPNLVPGDIVAERFVVERRAASGGMGVIYRGTDLLTRQAVAIKVMGPGLDADRFLHEAAMLARISHPSVVRYIAHGVSDGGTPYLVMEWLDGEDLSARLARSGVSVADAIRVVRSACAGVAAAHAVGIFHRDIKPSNLFLVNGSSRSVKVLDFGIARCSEETRTLTGSGVLLGTVGYMSPEQAMEPRDVDARTDVFALGCVLFECVTGRPAFVGRNPVAVLANVLKEDPPLVSEVRPELGYRLDGLVYDMLSKDPDRRPRDARAALGHCNKSRGRQRERLAARGRLGR